MISLTRAFGVLAVLGMCGPPVARGDQPVDIGARRELFVDRYLIGEMKNVQLRLHEPREQDVAIRHDKPWEGKYAGYTTVIKDGSTYRMYYRGLPDDGAVDGTNAETTCYAESPDGVHWAKPDLGLFEVQGTRANNVILADAAPLSHNFAPLLDTRPGVPADQRFKALGGIDKSGLVAFASADGVRWRKLREQPVLTRKDVPFKFNWLFDSQNLAFWSEAEQCYVAYFRVYDGLRKVARSTSKDFLSWTPAVLMEQVTDDGSGAPKPAPVEHIYTSQTTPYFRAPHIYLALPSRFMDGKDALTQEQKTQIGVASTYMAPGSGFNDMPLMTSRAGSSRYDRTFMEAWIRPGPDPKAWTSRANYPAAGIVPTPPGDPKELSIYVDRHVGYASAHVARFTLRLDGFVSVNAPYAGGELVTKPLVFKGGSLSVNFATSAVGGVRVEIQDAGGKPIPGYALEECAELLGDDVDRVVTWKRDGGKLSPDVSKLAGQSVRLRFVMKDADLYAVQFRAGDAK